MLQLLLAIIYLSFISLGLPDSLLGSAWPSMYREFSVPVSYAGIISMIIAAGTIVSSLYSDRLTGRFATGRVTAASVGLTCLALFGFSFSHTFGLLVLWAVPYGLGAGAVDASLNSYVALHYKSRHMSWLHCMWGIGASLGPSIMGYAIAKGQTWNTGYRWIGYIQLVLTAVLLLSLPLWHEKAEDAGKTEMAEKALSLREILRIPGAEAVMITFFCYCALEQTAGLWASSYLALHWNVSAETAASFAGMFYIGITIGRAVSGFLTFRLNDTALIRLGQGGDCNRRFDAGVACIFKAGLYGADCYRAWLCTGLSFTAAFHSSSFRHRTLSGSVWRTDGFGLYRFLSDAAAIRFSGPACGDCIISILSACHPFTDGFHA